MSDDVVRGEQPDLASEVNNLLMWLVGIDSLRGQLPAPDSYKTPEIRPSAISFEKNLLTVTSIGDVLNKTWVTSMLFNNSETAACLELFGAIDRPTLDFSKVVTDEDVDNYRRKCQEVRELQHRLCDGIETSPYFYASHASTLDYASFFHESVKAKFASLMASQVILSWTAFETLATDLWVAVLNGSPRTLAELKGKPKSRIGEKAGERRSGSGDGDGSQGPGDDGPSVDLRRIGRITGHGYDLSAKMGTLLKSRFKFSTLKGIREAYSKAFPAGGATDCTF